MDDVENVRKRFLDLYRRSQRDTRYCFTDFLSAADQSELISLEQSGQIDARYVSLYGGCEGAERQIARFGCEEEFGWTEDFPITILEVAPVLEKYGEELSHRDYLGSLMGLNIDRDTIGDIRISGKKAWIFTVERMADFILENLDEVRHTHVKVMRTDSLPEDAQVHFQEMELIVSSERVDAVVAKLTNLARSKVLELFRKQKVFINGRCTTDNSKKLAEGDILSVRGWGRAECGGIQGRTKKDRVVMLIKKYV
jgi:RNA-binding protein YlmH